MKRIKHFPLWLLTGLLYGLSWPIFDSINLSFLAWFAFVPLLIFLEKNQGRFWRSMLGSYAAMVVFGCFSAGWIFNFPQPKIEIAFIFFFGEIFFFMPFLFFFFIHKRIQFDKTLWLFPFVWMLWEWIYLNLEFTMGTHLSPYSQSNNIWLIQYIDITGMWGVSFWLMLFNVLIFKALKHAAFNLKNGLLYKKLAYVCSFMIGIPLLYSAFAWSNYAVLESDSIQVSLLPTQYSAEYLRNQANSISVVEQTLHRTDSLAFTMKSKGHFSDLYLWPETGTNYWMEYSNLGSLLKEAVNDWEAALVTGCKGIPDNIDRNDPRTYVSGVLISHQQAQAAYHHKTVLIPGQEAIPYHSILAKIPYFPIEETDPRYYKSGQESQPLDFTTRNKKKVSLGVSLCYEQWYPHHWAALARNGADFYAHLAGENWYGDVGFQTFMANVSRMRCIENRHQAARCANVGLSLFIDQMGRYHHLLKKGTLTPSTAKLYTSDIITWYARYPNWFPYLCLIIFSIILLFNFYKTLNDE